jgi:hypothetical protein
MAMKAHEPEETNEAQPTSEFDFTRLLKEHSLQLFVDSNKTEAKLVEENFKVSE